MSSPFADRFDPTGHHPDFALHAAFLLSRRQPVSIKSYLQTFRLPLSQRGNGLCSLCANLLQNEVGSQRGSSTPDSEEGFHRLEKAVDFSTRSVSDVSNYLFPNRTGGFHRIRLSRSAIHPPWSCAASTATQVRTLCITLDPFPMSWALPQAFE